MFCKHFAKGVFMPERWFYFINSKKNHFFLSLIILTFLCLFTCDLALATVESSIKGVGSSLQKTAVGVAVAAFSVGGAGMMFGAQWGYRLALGTIMGLCFVLGGPAIVTYFSSQIR
jgi:hypothetical protein